MGTLVEIYIGSVSLPPTFAIISPLFGKKAHYFRLFSPFFVNKHPKSTLLTVKTPLAS